MLIQRFIINLRHAASPAEASATQPTTATGSRGLDFHIPNVHSAVGDIGQSLHFAGDDDEPGSSDGLDDGNMIEEVSH